MAVPDGSPEELVNFIKNLGEHQPENRDEQSMKEFAVKAGAAALIAAEKILAAKPTDEQAEIAVQVKCAVLSMQDQEGSAEAARQLKEFAGKLEKAGRPKLARMAQACVLQQRIMKARAAEPAELKKRIEEAKKFVAGGTVDVPEAQLALAVIQVAERSGQTDLIVDVNRFFGKALAASGNKEIANLGKKLEGAATRLTLVGKAMPLEGSTLEGKPLEWAKYRGKIVLVDFWATWCGPCLQEMKNIRKQYEGYHEKGFDVVGVSVDEDRQALESFVKENKVPWTVVTDHALEKEADDKSMATRYGVSGIPECILVGKDGKVLALSVRGKVLADYLEKLLGAPVKTKADTAELKAEKEPKEEKTEK